MDEANRLKIFCPLHRLLAPPRPLLFFVFALIGCLAPEAKPLAPPSPDAFQDLAKSVAQWRELSLGPPVYLRIQLEAIIGEQIPFAAASGSASMAQLEPAYKAIGLLAHRVDLSAALTEYRKLVGLITYDPAENTVIIATDAARLGAPLQTSRPSAAHELPAALGVMRALQERHFNWRARINASATDDQRMALCALATGDALLAALSRATGEKPAPANLTALAQIAGQVDRMAKRLPDFLRRRATFPYRDGGGFVYWAFASRSWPGVDALYADPPWATAQVLHPEKYFIRREPPLYFFPAALLRRLKTSALVEDSIGELSIRTLLESAHTPKYAAETAAAWRGDQLFSFQRGGELDVFWFSSWNDEAAATQFLQAYQPVLQGSHRLRFERVAQVKNLAVIAIARDRGAWLLEQRGATVLAAHSATAKRVTELAEEAWQDLEIDAQPAAVRFESARRQISFR